MLIFSIEAGSYDSYKYLGTKIKTVIMLFRKNISAPDNTTQ